MTPERRAALGPIPPSQVLVADVLADFLHTEAIPEWITASTFDESAGIPAHSCVGLIPVVTTRVGAAEMDRLRGLKIIANYGVGYDNIDVAAARERGIAVTNTPGVLTHATAELTWALILATARRLGEGERMVRSRKWQGWQPTQLRGMNLNGRTLGIVGAGRIGREVGRMAAAFRIHVIYWSRTRHTDWERECGAEFVELDKLLETADVISIHIAKSGETEALIEANALAKLRDGAILINTARGAIINEAALIQELKTGRIEAGLDVYPNEPHVADELISLENVVLLPHIGSATFEARQAMWDLAWKNLLCGLSGEPLLNPVG